MDKFLNLSPFRRRWLLVWIAKGDQRHQFYPGWYSKHLLGGFVVKRSDNHRPQPKFPGLQTQGLAYYAEIIEKPVLVAGNCRSIVVP